MSRGRPAAVNTPPATFLQARETAVISERITTAALHPAQERPPPRSQVDHCCQPRNRRVQADEPAGRPTSQEPPTELVGYGPARSTRSIHTSRLGRPSSPLPGELCPGAGGFPASSALRSARSRIVSRVESWAWNFSTRSGGHGLVSSAVRSALVNGLAVDDRGILGERHRRAAVGYRTRGRDAAAFQIVLSGIRTTPERPPRNAFAAGFSGLALARRRRRRR